MKPTTYQLRAWQRRLTTAYLALESIEGAMAEAGAPKSLRRRVTNAEYAARTAEIQIEAITAERSRVKPRSVS